MAFTYLNPSSAFVYFVGLGPGFVSNCLGLVILVLFLVLLFFCLGLGLKNLVLFTSLV